MVFILDLYECTGELLGQGAQGAVQCYRSKKTGVEYAGKVGYVVMKSND